MSTLDPNPFKTRLLAGELQIGLWCSLANATATEIVADSGFDWLLIDTEHTPNELNEVVNHLRVSQRSKTYSQSSPIVRPAWNDTVLIKRFLDVGAQTLLIPFVQNAQEAAQAVAATRYPPLGVRGVTSSGRAARYGRVKNYLANAASELCVLVQVETKEALNDIESIAGVEGVDGVFIGPSDLSASYGQLGNPAHPEIQAALKQAVDRLKAMGKPAGILTSSEEEAKRYIEWGYRFVAVGTDVGLLARNADALAQRFKP